MELIGAISLTMFVGGFLFGLVSSLFGWELGMNIGFGVMFLPVAVAILVLLVAGLVGLWTAALT